MRSNSHRDVFYALRASPNVSSSLRVLVKAHIHVIGTIKANAYETFLARLGVVVFSATTSTNRDVYNTHAATLSFTKR